MTQPLAPTLTSEERLMIAGDPRCCPKCHAPLEPWSDSSYGSYGLGCLGCKLFWRLDIRPDDRVELWVSAPLDQAFFPVGHRGIPAYRAAVGWVGP